MNSEMLSDAIGKLDETFVAKLSAKRDARIPKRHFYLNLTAAILSALMICMLAVGGALYLKNRTEKAKLPILSVDASNTSMGFEGYNVYDVYELKGNNPYDPNKKLDCLPVYKNYAYTSAGIPVFLSEEEMKEKARSTAKTLGAAVTEFKTIEGELPPDSGYEPTDGKYKPVIAVYGVSGLTDIVTVNVYGNGSIGISFSDGAAISVNGEINEKALSNFIVKYNDVCNIDDPVPGIWCDYTFTGKQMMNYSVFQNAAGYIDKIINYNLQSVHIYEKEGKISSINIPDIAASTEKLGDYPVINEKRARELLSNKNFITSVTYDFPEDNPEIMCELVYRCGNLEKIFMPYYKFYIELTDADIIINSEGMKIFGAYYVPAVEEEYLEALPVWEGSFN